jgi:cytoskeleton protein RodZ
MKGDRDNATETELEKEFLAPQPGPGSRLSKARLAANMTVEEVAAGLNLTLGIVEALERDAADELPAPVFVRGYINNYARLVGLRGEELVNQYEKVREPEVPLELRHRPASAAPRIRRGLSLRSVVLVLLVSGGGVAALWWFQGSQLSVGDLARIGGPEPAPVAVAPVPAPVMPEPSPAPVVAPEPTTDSTVPSSEPSEPDKMEMVAPAPVAVVEAPAPAEPAPPPEPAGHRLKLKLKNDVWVEIVDDDGSRLVFDMLRGGTTREVTGEGPFLVLLGKAGAVAVELNGNAVDHSAFERKGIARFVLDDEDGEIVTRAP